MNATISYCETDEVHDAKQWLVGLDDDDDDDGYGCYLKKQVTCHTCPSQFGVVTDRFFQTWA